MIFETNFLFPSKPFFIVSLVAAFGAFVRTTSAQVTFMFSFLVTFFGTVLLRAVLGLLHPYTGDEKDPI
jgi:hypothetical protein